MDVGGKKNVKNPQNIGGVIDFGDMVFTWRVADLAIAMMYAMVAVIGKSKQSCKPIEAAELLCEGFEKHANPPLDDFEKKVLWILVGCRLATSISIGAFSIAKVPENREYLEKHAKPSWDALALLMK